MNKIILKDDEDRLLKERYPWIFDNQIKSLPIRAKPGDIVTVVNSKGKFLGKGFFSPASLITVRLLTFKDIDVDDNFFYERIIRSIKSRERFIKNSDAFRLIYSEADGLPTLIADKYGEFIVIQTLGIGTDIRKSLFVDILTTLLKPKGIYERNDVPIRKLENLPLNKGLLCGKVSDFVTITENGIKFYVDIKNGQKTGFYLDQRDNRDMVKDFSKNTKVLDCFCYTGGFSIYALRYGALYVTGIDISEGSVGLAKKNAALNNITGERFSFQVGNAFDELKRFDKRNERFDLVILDPPSFTRKKETIEAALRGYKEINLRAMKILNPGGILVTCVCSYHVGLESFKDILIQAASDTKRLVKILDIKTHPKDHPVLLQLKESHYLKCFALEVI